MIVLDYLLNFIENIGNADSGIETELSESSYQSLTMLIKALLGTEMSEEFAAWCVKGANGGYTITESCSEKLREKLCEHYGE